MSTQSEIQTKVRDIVKNHGWDKVWDEKLTPWDAGQIQPPLREIIESDRVNWPRSGRALVPGCGGGYDVKFIASSLGLQVTGVDISPIGIKVAKETHGDTLENVSFEVGDFFALTNEESFDLIYDYTFFVALPPAMRPDWGKQMTKLIKRGGFLITLMFPLDPPQDYGPPYFVRPNHYEEVLGTKWEKIVDEVPSFSSPTHVDRERLVVWKRL